MKRLKENVRRCYLIRFDYLGLNIMNKFRNNLLYTARLAIEHFVVLCFTNIAQGFLSKIEEQTNLILDIHFKK